MMLRSVKELLRYGVLATDGAIGRTDDFYFDDVTWTIHYIVVDTGEWLPGRRVLVSPLALGQPDWESKLLPVNLTRAQVENSPDIDTARPVSRQQEAQLFAHYSWPPYWESISPFEASAAGLYPETYLRAMRAAETDREEALTTERLDAPTLRSVREVIDYTIDAADGEIGHVEDFIVDDTTWAIRYMVVDTRNWLPGKKVLVAPEWIEFVNWAESKVHVGLDRETVKNSPEYDPAMPVNREYEVQLYDFYGRPTYWD